MDGLDSGQIEKVDRTENIGGPTKVVYSIRVDSLEQKWSASLYPKDRPLFDIRINPFPRP